MVIGTYRSSLIINKICSMRSNRFIFTYSLDLSFMSSNATLITKNNYKEVWDTDNYEDLYFANVILCWHFNNLSKYIRLFLHHLFTFRHSDFFQLMYSFHSKLSICGVPWVHKISLVIRARVFTFHFLNTYFENLLLLTWHSLSLRKVYV